MKRRCLEHVGCVIIEMPTRFFVHRVIDGRVYSISSQLTKAAIHIWRQM